MHAFMLHHVKRARNPLHVWRRQIQYSNGRGEIQDSRLATRELNENQREVIDGFPIAFALAHSIMLLESSNYLNRVSSTTTNRIYSKYILFFFLQLTVNTKALVINYMG